MAETLSLQDLSRQAQAAYQQGDYAAAAKLYLAAAESCLAAQDTLQAAELRNNAGVAWMKAGEAQPALEAVEGTPALFAVAGDLRRQGMALGNLAAALESLQRLPEAIEIYQQAADVLGQCGETENRAYVLKSLSILHLRAGRQWQALATMEAGLDGLAHPGLSERVLRRLLRSVRKLLPQA